ncbi:hypothetical protein [Sporolactobacillus sp. THM19-2]|uniref:hypothetical protein n=1 Tax=Sporolactobacillus sp. THM19-2 TaxID=2511171 RepID=UPI0010215F6A|nr:hypothetical protein [Sporolactobacillus sp. THM19-2]RYL92404.1 hypothetical protein EWH91_07655 [Sporolactobacillus sp. THM19-2]
MDEDTLHIAAANSLADYLDKQSHNRALILSYEQLQKRLFPVWNSRRTQIELESIIHRLLISLPDSPVKNKMIDELDNELISSVRYLVNLNLMDIHTEDQDMQEMKIFSDIMKHLKENQIVLDYQSNMKQLTATSIFQKLGRTFHRIAVYQMDFIDAARLHFFYKLDSLSFPVTFFVPYNNTFKKFYEGWSRIYDQVFDTRNVLRGKDIPGTSGTQSGEKLINFVENKKDTEGMSQDQADEGLHLMHFRSEKAALDYSLGHHQSLISLDTNHIRPFLPLMNQYEERIPLSEYIQGQFFSHILEVKKSENKLFLNYSTFVKMISSGWINDGKVSGTSATGLLTDLRDYMTGVETLEEIVHRLHVLLRFRDCESEFDKLSGAGADHDYIKEYLTNPFHAFPYFEKQRYEITLDQLIKLSEKLQTCLRQFSLGDSDVVHCSHYIKRLITFMEIQQKHGTSSDPIINEFIRAFKQYPVDDNWYYTKKELAELFKLILGYQDHSKSVVISRFNQVSGVALSQKSIHLSDMTSRLFPERKYVLPEYLRNYNWIKQCILNETRLSVSEKMLLLHCLNVDQQSRELVPEMSRYYLYYLLAFRRGSLTISWADNSDSTEYPASFLKLINYIYFGTIEFDLTEQKIGYLQWVANNNPETLLSLPSTEELSGKIPDVSWIDYDFCPKKFFYTSVLNYHPVYTSDFHQRLLFSIISKLISQISGGKEGAEEYLYPLFPQWTDELKKNLVDTQFYQPLREYKTFDSIQYPRSLAYIQRLRSQYLPTKRWKIKYRYKKNTLKDDDALHDLKENYIHGESVDATPGPHCKMCPFLLICDKGRYPVDELNI